jgi:hypothetical protein
MRWKAPVRHTRGERGDTVHACKPIVKHHLLFHFGKSQSAMEYLMTYGWAILIIAVVLGALFQLGVFNANNFAPKAPPGACQVFRPNGPGTTSFINLEGVCSGELPQYTAETAPSGQNYVLVPFSAYNGKLGNPLTVVAWIYPITSTGDWRGAVYFGNDCGQAETLGVVGGNNQVSIDTCGDWGGNFYTNFYAPQNTWSFIAFNQSGTAITIHFNSQSQSFTATSAPMPTLGNVILGDDVESSSRPSYAILLANIQIYNTSLSANEIQSLYLEGIGGAPIDLQNLVAWWPLNGNANDYSGNGNNGQINGGVTFVSNWWNGYTPP